MVMSLDREDSQTKFFPQILAWVCAHWCKVRQVNSIKGLTLDLVPFCLLCKPSPKLKADYSLRVAQISTCVPNCLDPLQHGELGGRLVGLGRKERNPTPQQKNRGTGPDDSLEEE